MRRLVSSEVLKMRTVLMPRIVLAIAVLGSAFLAHVAVRVAVDTGEKAGLHDVVRAASQPLWFLAMVVAVIATAGEFQHRTVRTTLLQAPRRRQAFAATSLAAAGYGGLLCLLGAAAALTSGALTMRSEGLSLTVDGVLSGLGATVAIGALWALLGAGLGAITRSTTVSIVAVLLWRLVLEGVVPSVTGRPGIAGWLPGGAADAVLQSGPSYLEPLAGGLLFAGYAVVVVLAATWVSVHRDPA